MPYFLEGKDKKRPLVVGEHGYFKTKSIESLTSWKASTSTRNIVNYWCAPESPDWKGWGVGEAPGGFLGMGQERWLNFSDFDQIFIGSLVDVGCGYLDLQNMIHPELLQIG